MNKTIINIKNHSIMKLQMLKLVAIVALLTVSVSCRNDHSDCGCPEGANEVINSGKASSFFAIDNNIISFAVPYVVCTFSHESFWLPPEYNYAAHFWTITLLMSEGTDATKLAPIITLAPGARINYIYTDAQGINYVDYTEIAKITATDFSKQVEIQVIATDGSTVEYDFMVKSINDF